MECKQFIWMGSVTEVACKCLKWAKYISEFNEDFIKSYNDDSDEGYFLEVDL